jgi:hypothetical protein
MYPAKYALIAMLVLGALAVVGSQWFYAYMQKRPITLWGSGAASAIMQSPKVFALRLGEPGVEMTSGGIQIITAGGVRRGVIERREVGNTPGFSHLRTSLIHDNTFDWDAPTDDCQPDWTYGLEFLVGESNWTIFFAPNCRRLKLAQTGAVATLRSSEGMEKFLKERFAEVKEPRRHGDTEKKQEGETEGRRD